MPSPEQRLHPLRATASALLIIVAGATATACRGSALAFGPTPGAAEANATDFFGALSERFTNVQRAPKFYRARSKLGRYALTPSKIFGDSSIWSAVSGDDSRSLSIEGRFVDGRFVLTPRPAVPVPELLGQQRHVMRLRRLDDSEYEWTTSVEHAVGGVRAADIADVFAATIAAATARAGREKPAAETARDIRADYRSAFPRTTAALGQLFSIDSIGTVAGVDGGTSLTLRIGIHPERVDRSYPAFAQYLRKYVGPSRYRFVLRDASGARWLDAAAGKNVLTVRLRATRDGQLLPLEGAPRPMPETLTLTAEFFTHILLFDVGVSALKADFTVLRAEHERAWLMRFRTEPQWHLPLASRYLIRAPLRRPFKGPGAQLRISIRDADGAQTLLARHSTIAVQESAILRFLGSLGFSAMSDFAGKAEAEENRFIAEAFAALREDSRALLTSASR